MNYNKIFHHVVDRVKTDGPISSIIDSDDFRATMIWVDDEIRVVVEKRHSMTDVRGHVAYIWSEHKHHRFLPEDPKEDTKPGGRLDIQQLSRLVGMANLFGIDVTASFLNHTTEQRDDAPVADYIFEKRSGH